MSKKKKPEPLTETESSLRAAELIEQYGKPVLISMLLLFVAFVVLYRISSGTRTEALETYLSAETQFKRFMSVTPGNPQSAKQSLEEIQATMVEEPELQTKYDPPLAQKLISIEQVNPALPLAKSTLSKQNFEQLPYYRDFAEITLLIETHRYDEALETSQKLLSDLDSNQELAFTHPEKQTFGPLLYAYNLIRIAMLQKKLGQFEGEQNTWNLFSEYQENFPEATAQIAPLINSLRSGTYTLDNYMEERTQNAS